MNKIDEQKRNKEFMKEADVWKYFVQMMRGLKTLHDMKIVHRDIKCANLFLMKSGDLKLGDLNVSKVATQGML